MVLLSAFTTLKMAPFVRLERIWFWSSSYFNRNTKPLPINFTSLIWSRDPLSILLTTKISLILLTKRRWHHHSTLFENATHLWKFFLYFTYSLRSWRVASFICNFCPAHSDCLSKSHLRIDRRRDGGLFLYQNLSEEKSQKPYWKN